MSNVTDEFAALCANEPELARLRASIREFLAADRAEAEPRPPASPRPGVTP